MFILLLFLLFILPLVGFVFELMGLGSTYQSEVLLPGLTLANIRPLLLFYSRSAGWSLLHHEETPEKVLFMFQAHQWGNNKSGVQKVTMTFFVDENGVKGFIRSDSLLGQFIDFGVNQKNVEEVSFYLSDKEKQEYVINQQEIQKESFIVNKPPLDFRYYAAIMSVAIVYAIISFIIAANRHVVPGYIEVTFRPGVTIQAGKQALDSVGALNCIPGYNNDAATYLCEVPVTEEEQVAERARTVPIIKNAQPRYK